MLFEVAVDGGLKVDDGPEDAAADAPSGEGGEEVFGVKWITQRG